NNDYELSAPLVAAQTEYTVGCMQFTKSDGTRFNPLTMKAQRFFIWAYNGENKRASWAASWK
ncbi:MAG: hypothetical protein M0R49_07105, partial [Limnochordia bacterium]|nr:hypothetical protein [Limnochordia bacterium]